MDKQDLEKNHIFKPIFKYFIDFFLIPKTARCNLIQEPIKSLVW